MITLISVIAAAATIVLGVLGDVFAALYLICIGPGYALTYLLCPRPPRVEIYAAPTIIADLKAGTKEFHPRTRVFYKGAAAEMSLEDAVRFSQIVNIK